LILSWVILKTWNMVSTASPCFNVQLLSVTRRTKKQPVTSAKVKLISPGVGTL